VLNRKLKIPKFKSEKEEAGFWDANSDYFMERLMKCGKVAGALDTERAIKKDDSKP
jgi:hypothetical protein